MAQHQAAAANDSITKRRSPHVQHDIANDKANAHDVVVNIHAAIALLLIYNYNNNKSNNN